MSAPPSSSGNRAIPSESNDSPESNDSRLGRVGRLRSQGLGFVCRQATVLMLALGSVIMVSNEGAAAPAMDDLRAFFQQPSVGISGSTCSCPCSRSMAYRRLGARLRHRHDEPAVDLGPGDPRDAPRERGRTAAARTAPHARASDRRRPQRLAAHQR